MSVNLCRTSVVVASQGQVSCNLDGEAVVLSLADGVYYSLNDVGTKIWQLLQERRTVAEIRDALLCDYEVDEELCERDVMRLLEQMAEWDLVEVNDAPAN